MSDYDEIARLAIDRGLITADQAEACLRQLKDESTSDPFAFPRLLLQQGLVSVPQYVALCRLCVRGTPAMQGWVASSEGEEDMISTMDLQDPPQIVSTQPPRPLIGRYEVLDVIGHGGMGVVYRARDPELDRDVAIKTIIHARSTSERYRKRLEREARVIARLRHPNIVGVHELGETGGKPWVAMEYVEGDTLESLLEQRKLSRRRVVEILRDTARALDYAHREGVVHRDVKPLNILVDHQGKARLVDFGLALDVEASDQLTGSGDLLGTLSYLAPEQANLQHQAVGPATDVHAVGAVLYRALAGEPPFTGEHLVTVLRKIIGHAPVPLRRRDPSIPRDLEAITLLCLKKSPSQRYASADALAEDLVRHLAGQPVEAVSARKAPGKGAVALAVTAALAIWLGARYMFLPGVGVPAAPPSTTPASATQQANTATAPVDLAAIRELDAQQSSDAALALWDQAFAGQPELVLDFLHDHLLRAHPVMQPAVKRWLEAAASSSDEPAAQVASVMLRCLENDHTARLQGLETLAGLAESHLRHRQVREHHARLLWQLGRTEAALEAADVLFAQWPQRACHSVLRAQALRALHRWDEAKVAVSNALELDPQLASAWLEQGWLQLDLFDPEAAMDSFGRARDLAPGSALPLEGLAAATARQLPFTRWPPTLAAQRASWQESLAFLSLALQKEPLRASTLARLGTFRLLDQMRQRYTQESPIKGGSPVPMEPPADVLALLASARESQARDAEVQRLEVAVAAVAQRFSEVDEILVRWRETATDPVVQLFWAAEGSGNVSKPGMVKAQALLKQAQAQTPEDPVTLLRITALYGQLEGLDGDHGNRLLICLERVRMLAPDLIPAWLLEHQWHESPIAQILRDSPPGALSRNHRRTPTPRQVQARRQATEHLNQGRVNEGMNMLLDLAQHPDVHPLVPITLSVYSLSDETFANHPDWPTERRVALALRQAQQTVEISTGSGAVGFLPRALALRARAEARNQRFGDALDSKRQALALLAQPRLLQVPSHDKRAARDLDKVDQLVGSGR